MDFSNHSCPACGGVEFCHFGRKEGYDLICCARCQLVAVFPIPGDAVLTAFYQDYHKTHQYLAKLDSKVRRARSRIRRFSGRGKGRTFLDVGCNAGFAVAAAAQLGYVASGIDIDDEAVKLAAEKFRAGSFETISVQQLARRGVQFDVIYCSEVIEHLPALADFLDAVRTLMHNDSRLFITTPDLGHFTLRAPFNREPLIEWDAVRPPEHLYYFNRQNLQRLLNRHGFGQVRCSWNHKPTLKAVVRL